MTSTRILGALITIVAAASNVACAKKTAPVSEPEAAEPLAPVSENTQSLFVEGVAGGVMLQTVELEAEVISVDQDERIAILRGPEGNAVTVHVGEGAVNFYQVAAGDRVNVMMARELVVYVAGDEEGGPDGTAAVAARAEKGDTPAGVVVASSKVTSTIKAIDIDARTATLALEDGTEETFNVRPDVDMTKYSVDQQVVFLITEMLALEVKKI